MAWVAVDWALLMALSIDQPAPPELVERLRGEVADARFLSLE